MYESMLKGQVGLEFFEDSIHFHLVVTDHRYHSFSPYHSKTKMAKMARFDVAICYLLH